MLRAGLVGSAATSIARHPRRARRDRHQRRQHPHGRRLAGAVRPEEAEDLTRRDLEVDAAHRLDVAAPAAEGLDELAGLDGGRHDAAPSGRSAPDAVCGAGPVLRGAARLLGLGSMRSLSGFGGVACVQTARGP